ncbi:MAG: transposase [Sphingobacteriales bacterium]|nr:transposase [Sphingobacteriales bacterium]
MLQLFYRVNRTGCSSYGDFSQINLPASRKTGIYYIDAKALPVCDMLRAKQHKVFAQTASKGKSSMGWFFGFKLHLIVNHKGQIVDFALTTGQVADNSKDLLNKLLEKISGTLLWIKAI